MTIKITSREAIKKIIAAINLRAKVQIEIPDWLIDDALEALEALAQKKGLRIEIVNPDSNRILTFGSGGAVAGGVLGYLWVGLPGALAGAALGFGVGFATAQVKIAMLPSSEDGKVYLELA